MNTLLLFICMTIKHRIVMQCFELILDKKTITCIIMLYYICAHISHIYIHTYTLYIHIYMTCTYTYMHIIYTYNIHKLHIL